MPLVELLRDNARIEIPLEHHAQPRAGGLAHVLEEHDACAVEDEAALPLFDDEIMRDPNPNDRDLSGTVHGWEPLFQTEDETEWRRIRLSEELMKALPYPEKNALVLTLAGLFGREQALGMCWMLLAQMAASNPSVRVRTAIQKHVTSYSVTSEAQAATPVAYPDPGNTVTPTHQHTFGDF